MLTQPYFRCRAVHMVWLVWCTSRRPLLQALHHKANLCFDDSLLNKVLQDYDDDGTGVNPPRHTLCWSSVDGLRSYRALCAGIINFRKFCENVLDSKVGQADCVTKTKPSGMKNVVSSDAGTSDHFIRRKIRMAAKDLRLAFKARDKSGVGEIPLDEFRAGKESAIRFTGGSLNCTALAPWILQGRALCLASFGGLRHPHDRRTV